MYLLVYCFIIYCVLVREINTNLPSSGSVMVKLETCGYSKIPETGSLNLSWKSSVHSYWLSFTMWRVHVFNVWPKMRCNFDITKLSNLNYHIHVDKTIQWSINNNDKSWFIMNREVPKCSYIEISRFFFHRLQVSINWHLIFANPNKKNSFNEKVQKINYILQKSSGKLALRQQQDHENAWW